LTTNPPYASSIALTNVSLSNPFTGYPGGNPFPGAAIFPVGGTYVSIPQNVRPTYMMQWNLSLQHQFGKDWLATVNYIGNKTTHVLGSYDVDPAVPTIAGATASNTNSRRLLYLQNPAQGQYYGDIQVADDGGTAHYNGLVTSIQHRFAQHFTILSNFTWSHCTSDVDFTGELAGVLYQNPNNRAAEKGNCGFDRRLNFVNSIVATSPSIGSGLTKVLTSNWQLSPIFTAYTGQPFTVSDNGKDISLTGQLLDRPNVVLPSQVIPAQQTQKEWFNQAAFAIQPTGTYGNSGRFNLYGPGAWNMDVALTRTFRITERFHLEARGESFNIFNHGNWNLASSALGNALFGQVNSFTSPRIMQVALKLTY
jgi:hypothetical protein